MPNIMLLVKDFQKKIALSVEEINLPSLKKFLDLSLALPSDENCVFLATDVTNLLQKANPH